MEIEAKVIANARRDNITMEHKRLKIKVSEQPRKGKANKAVEKLLSETFGCEVRVVSGLTCSIKNIYLDCTEQEFEQVMKRTGDINGKNIH